MRRIAVGVVVLGTLLVGGAAAGVAVAQPADAGTNVSFGAEVSSFMQASETEAETELEDGMFNATLNRTTAPEERRELVEERKQRLEERHESLRTQRETLDEGPDVRARAVAARIAVGARELERSVDRTEKVARGIGVDTKQFGRIKSNTSELRRPEVTRRAPEIVGPPGTPARGPPDSSPAENRPPRNGSAENRPMADRQSGNVSTPPGAPVTKPEDTSRSAARAEPPGKQPERDHSGASNESERASAPGASGGAGGNGDTGPGEPPSERSDPGPPGGVDRGSASNGDGNGRSDDSPVASPSNNGNGRSDGGNGQPDNRSGNPPDNNANRGPNDSDGPADVPPGNGSGGPGTGAPINDTRKASESRSNGRSGGERRGSGGRWR